MKAKRVSGGALVSEEEGLGFKFVRSYSFGRKRVSIAKNNVHSEDLLNLDCTCKPPSKRLCSLEPEKSNLESLPQDILVSLTFIPSLKFLDLMIFAFGFLIEGF